MGVHPIMKTYMHAYVSYVLIYTCTHIYRAM